MNQLVRFDTNSLNRALVGFDTIFENFEHRFANQLNQNYPPYNVVKRDEDHYEVQIAVSGFRKDEIDLTVENNELLIKGTKFEETDTAEYLHRGLAARNFERAFTLGQYLEVDTAEIKDGLLIIKLERHVPDAMKPKKIEITAA
jgi:molecular chaperone IbpA